MASPFNPFQIFRKYQKTGLAAITLLAMFAFVCVSPSMRGSSGGGNEIPIAAKWNYGDILQTEVNARLSWRMRINKFLAIIHEMAIEANKVNPETSPAAPSFTPATPDGVLDSMVLEKKAELMGMTVSDQAVNDFIDSVTNGPLAQKDKEEALLKAVGEGRGSAAQLSNQFFDALRFELLARNLRMLLANDVNVYVTPDERWDYFSRLERTATVQAMPVAVKDFVDKIPDPSEAELTAFFDKYKDQQSRADLPDPGFKVPPRGKFEFFKAERATFAKAEEPKITDQEIDDYYAKNKENYRKSSLDESAPPASEKPKAGEKPTAGEKPKSDKSTNAVKPKAEPKPATTDKSKPADASKNAPQPKPDDKAKPAAPKPPEPKPSGDKSTDGKSSDSRSVVHPFADDELLALAPDPATPPPSAAPAAPPTATNPAAANPTAANPTAAKPTAAKPAATNPTAANPPETKPAETKPADKDAAPAKDEPPKTDATKATPTKTEPAKTGPAKTGPATTPPAKAGGETAPDTEFRSLTDPKVRGEIRTILANQKAANVVNQALEKLKKPVDDYRQELSNWRADGSPAGSEPPVPDFQAAAKGFGVSFEQTGMLSAEETETQTELAKASYFDEVRRQQIPFDSEAFDPNWPAYRPSEMDSPRDEISYLWWRSEFAPSSVPAFQDAKSEVLRSWKMKEARKVALIEAKKDAEEANKRMSTLKELFQNRANLPVKQVGPFHWLDLGNMALGQSNQQLPMIARAPGLDLTGQEFMRTVFNTDVGRTAVAMNDPQTIAYVVQVQKFDPAEEAFRLAFKTYETQVALNPGYDQARLAAQIGANRVFRAKFLAIQAELGYQRLEPQTGGEGPSNSPAPSDDESDY
jgi:hypothetical protein